MARFNLMGPALVPLIKLLFVVNALPYHYNQSPGHQVHSLLDEEDPASWFYLISAAVFVLLGGVFAGLTIA